MKLGAFSVSLSVKDLATSQEFYEILGFKVFAGSVKDNYLVMKNGFTLIGLFYKMFEGTILTFNPGWDQNANTLDDFEDIRTIYAILKDKGVTFSNELEKEGTGPGSFMIQDPDGNIILLDQHI